jgi:hypothetical protein
MDSYFIRIYRFDRSKPMAIIGVVEEVGAGDKKTFMNYDELWNILNPTYGEPPKRGAAQKKQRKNKSGTA